MQIGTTDWAQNRHVRWREKACPVARNSSSQSWLYRKLLHRIYSFGITQSSCGPRSTERPCAVDVRPCVGGVPSGNAAMPLPRSASGGGRSPGWKRNWRTTGKFSTCGNASSWQSGVRGAICQAALAHSLACAEIAIRSPPSRWSDPIQTGHQSRRPARLCASLSDLVREFS